MNAEIEYYRKSLTEEATLMALEEVAHDDFKDKRQDVLRSMKSDLAYFELPPDLLEPERWPGLARLIALECKWRYVLRLYRENGVISDPSSHESLLIVFKKQCDHYDALLFDTWLSNANNRKELTGFITEADGVFDKAKSTMKRTVSRRLQPLREALDKRKGKR